jgi:hypothetical protein
VTRAEMRFKCVVALLLSVDMYPSPGRIEYTLGRRVKHNLNGRQCRWREEYLTSIGWAHDSRQRYRIGVSFRPPPGKRLEHTRETGWRIVAGGS